MSTQSAIDNRHEQNNDCRLCGGLLTYIFSKKILGKYVVKYYKCSDCLSLQTETPYWLNEAYEETSSYNTDTGAAQRNIQNLAVCFIVSRLLKAENVVDIGGGDGLLCRLLRDYKINCYVEDKYTAPTYGRGFTEPDFLSPDFIIGFEVLEHYPNPSSDLDDLFLNRPRALLLSTGLYTNQPEDWWYFSPDAGQHVFFTARRRSK